MMNLETIRQLTLARDLYDLSISSLNSKNDLRLFSAVNLMQDAVEVFLLAVGSYVDAKIDQNMKFHQYIDNINKAIDPKVLPFKAKLLALNKIRVSSKHYGIQPDREEVVRVSVSIREFFEETSIVLLKSNFFTICAIDILDDGEVKDILLEAKNSFEKKLYKDCAIYCRKAIYMQIESAYDISPFKDRDEGGGLGLAFLFSSSPYYARNKRYVQENVKNSTDYIVLDRSHLEHDLLTKGVLVSDFWNVLRLTPEMYRDFHDENKRWIVKDDYKKFDEKELEQNIDYIFSKTIEIVLSLHAAKKRIKMSSIERKWYIELNADNIPLHEKADEKSTITASTPIGMRKIYVDFAIEGINDDSLYWHVSHPGEDAYLSGYVHNKFIVK